MSRVEDIRPNPATRSTPAGVLLAVILLAGQGVRYGVVNPAVNYQLDFRAYYVAGKALRAGANPYDQATLKETIHKELPGKQGLVGFANPPPILPLLYLLAGLPLVAAQVVWAWLQLLLVLGGTLLLLRAINVGLGSPVGVLIVAVYWLSDPVYNLFRWGQIDGFRVGLLGLAVYLLSRQAAAAAGVAIGLAALVKVYPALYLWVFLLRREWKALTAGLLTILVPMGLSLAVLDPATRQQYFKNNQRQLDTLDYIIPPQNLSLAGYMHRAVVTNHSELEPSQAWLDLGPGVARWASIGGIAGLVGITSLWIIARRRELTTAESIAGFVPVVILGEVIAWPHHCVSMLIPLGLMAWVAAGQERLRWFDAAWVGAALWLLAFSPVHQFRIELPKWLEHLCGPTGTYAMLLTWLFLLVRYPALKRQMRAVPE